MKLNRVFLGLALVVFGFVTLISCAQGEKKLLGSWEVIEFFDGSTPEEAGITIVYTFQDEGLLLIEYDDYPTESQWNYVESGDGDYIVIDGLPTDYTIEGRKLTLDFKPLQDRYVLMRK